MAYWILQAADGEITASFEPTFIGMPAGSADLLPGWVDPTWLDLQLPAYRIPT